jgi:phage-related protein
MGYYMPKPELIEAYVWNKNGDCPHDGVINNINEGEVVGRLSNLVDKDRLELTCPSCDYPLKDHGYMKQFAQVKGSIQIVHPKDILRFYRTPDLKKILFIQIMRPDEFAERFVPYVPPVAAPVKGDGLTTQY